MFDYLYVFHRHLTGSMLEALAYTPAVLVNGARQTGKSAVMHSSEGAGEDRQYLTFYDPGILAAAKADPNDFVAGLKALVTFSSAGGFRASSDVNIGPIWGSGLLLELSREGRV